MSVAAAARTSSRRSVLAVFLVATLVPLAFAAFTNHAWEDYYITLRSSRNLVEGNGLVFQPGERVHTFTSPLGVLVPAGCLWLAQGNDGLALWLFRALGALALATVAVAVWRRLTQLGVTRIGRAAFLGIWLADPKLIDCSTNGMETALIVALVLGLWCELERPGGPRLRRLAIFYAGLMWTRPDAFVLAGALTGARWLFADERGERVPWRLLGGAAALGALLYLPWFAWAWSYYGSPIPHTIVAKATQTPPPRLIDIALVPLRAIAGHSMCEYLFLPANYLFGGWPAALRVTARVLAVVAAGAWLVPAWPTTVRRTSFAVFVGLFYICVINLYAWYVPPWSALAALTWALLLDHVFVRATGSASPSWRRAAIGAAASLILFQAGQLTAVAWQARIQQRWIEDAGRRQIGLWLREHARAQDTVFLEPLGYIGYFSRLKTYDYPGLSSNEVTGVIRTGARRYGEIIARLKPEWVVLRPVEIEREKLRGPGLADYELVRTWDARPALAAVSFLPGRAWLDFDAEFLLYRRRPSQP